jgi:hypothetical protein
MPTEAPARTHCPNCGAKLHRQDLSLCAYCATPLTLGGKVETAGDETAKRLLRLRELPAFGTAMALTPRDPEVELRAERLRARGSILVVIFVVVLAYAALLSAPLTRPSVLTGALSASLALAILSFARAATLQRKSLALPLLRRPALVVDRRSVTAEKGGQGSTVYFFTLHFDDASEGEFRWPGQGTMYEPMPNGTTGLAYTRGERLIEFRKF